eukprot:COSAG01_NODE_15420_length_1333_cov_1.061290_1_plen_58_part_10
MCWRAVCSSLRLASSCASSVAIALCCSAIVRSLSLAPTEEEEEEEEEEDDDDASPPSP